jgi:predicted nucleotidyltransferase
MLRNNLNIIGEEIAKHYKLAFVVLFGSVATGGERKGSDIDIGVLKRDRTPLSYAEFRDIADAFSEKLTAHAFSKIDLVDLATANILLRYEITSGGVLLSGDGGEYEAYRIFALRDYRDSESLRQLETELIEKRQKELRAHIHA